MPNRLAAESSPYLRQHADNPVDWYPWGDEAFARARAEDKPVLLSVGYSACHWCHVMAHESFEDPETAGVMNALFINIKVDREERPDVDDIYMQAVLAMNGSGGWPMTVFLAPDGRPFFGGTYFPKQAVPGRPGFVQLLHAVAGAWADRRAELLGQADQLTAALRQGLDGAGGGTGLPTSEVLDRCQDALAASFDAARGGFGRAPKFPMPTNLELLLRHHARSGDPDTLAMVTTSLDAMASGGIYDHLGGGFARYSTDDRWLVPHFEKMLYDNALLARVYLHAWQMTGEPRYRQVVEETVGYVLRDLRAPDGGFYSAEDADSEGVEGKFYVWTPAELAAVLGDKAPAAAGWYGVTPGGNFEGASVLHRAVRGDILRLPDIEASRAELFEARARRPRPGRDDKILTEWNAMFIATLAEAGGALSRADYLRAATDAADRLLATLRRADGRWLRAWHAEGGARHLAYAADHAHLIDAFSRLAEATGRARWIAHACATADALLVLFSDDATGGLYTTGADAEALLVRARDTHDGATPSANSTAALALLRLGALTGRDRYREAARGILGFLGPWLTANPTAVTQAVAALDLKLAGAVEIVVSGERPELVEAVQRRYLPNAVLAWGEPYDSPLWEGRDRPGAYVCRDYTCSLPATSVEGLDAALQALTAPSPS